MADEMLRRIQEELLLEEDAHGSCFVSHAVRLHKEKENGN